MSCFCCCNYIFNKQLENPKKTSHFIETVMDPYGIQDKEIEQDKINEKKIKKTQDKQLKLLCKEIEETKILVNNNIIKTDEIYDKLESGELCEINLNKNNEENKNKKLSMSQLPNIFRLGWGESDDNIKLKINSNRSRSNSDSSDAMMDFDIICDKHNDTSDNEEEELNSEGEPINSHTNMDVSNNILTHKISQENNNENENKKLETSQNKKLEPTKSKQIINSKTLSKNK